MKIADTALFGSLLFLSAASAFPEEPTLKPASAPLGFAETGAGEFSFDTGVLRGTLRPGGASLGLLSVVHVPSGQRLDSSNGLLSHYRVFTKGVRHGGGAWDWPSTARLRSDGAVEIVWPATDQRAFEMRAIYQWSGSDTLDLETTVAPRQDLIGFESFLASYFSDSFTNCAVFASTPEADSSKGAFVSVALTNGFWQMFPRDNDVLPLIKDGRWLLEPNPVDWTIRPRLDKPLAFRRDPASGLTVVLMSLQQDCFAVSSPHQAEGHRSLYLSLFGRNLKAGAVARARTRMVVKVGPSEDEIEEFYRLNAVERDRVDRW